jgi:DNA-binding LacI/PurR family transcriptional regulator
VIIDRELKSVDIPYVGTDNIAAMTTAMDYLFAMGHRNICFMSGATVNTSTLENRLNGFRQAFLNKGYPGSANNEFSKIKSVCTKPTADLIEADIRNIYEHIMNNPQITCIFASEYAVCSLVKQALKMAGKKIPDDMSLITFDNICDPFHFSETTYLKQNQTEIGVQAVDILMKCIADGTTTSRIYLSCNLVQNSSVKDINA